MHVLNVYTCTQELQMKNKTFYKYAQMIDFATHTKYAAKKELAWDYLVTQFKPYAMQTQNMYVYISLRIF